MGVSGKLNNHYLINLPENVYFKIKNLLSIIMCNKVTWTGFSKFSQPFFLFWCTAKEMLDIFKSSSKLEAYEPIFFLFLNTKKFHQ